MTQRFGNRPENIPPVEAELRIPEDSIEYDMKHKNFGKCLIFNHEFYEDNIQDPRRGTQIDAKALNDCFSNIGFKVIQQNDLKFDTLLSVVSEGMPYVLI